jgi:hypothetical protein
MQRATRTLRRTFTIGSLMAALVLVAPAFAAPAGGTSEKPAGEVTSIDDLLLPLDLQSILEEPARKAKEVEENPLHYLAEDVKEIVKDLGTLETGEPVQNKQALVLAQLDAIIEKLQQQQQQSSGSGSASGANPSPTSPMQDSMLGGGPGGIGTLTDPATSHREWAKLPPAERDKILQSKTEGFPAGFEDVLAEYYEQLAREQTAGSVESPR